MSGSWYDFHRKVLRELSIALLPPLLIPLGWLLGRFGEGGSLLMGLSSLLAVLSMKSALTKRRWIALTADCVLCYLLSARPAGVPAWSMLLGAALLTGVCILSGARLQRLEYERQQNNLESERTRLMTELNMRLMTARGMEAIRQQLLAAIFESCGHASVFFELLQEEPVRICSDPPGLIIYRREIKTAAMAARTGRVTGVGTNLCVHSVFRCYPIRFSGTVTGVVAVLMGVEDHTPGQLQFLDALLSRGSVALERQRLIDLQQEIITEKQVEKARASFLSAISHDLRTPLTAIMGACSALSQTPGIPEGGLRLLSDIREESEWLTQMVENLLSITRVTTDRPRLNFVEEAVEEVVGEAAFKCANRFPQLALQVEVPEQLVILKMDAMLITQVILNLVENAVKYGGEPQAAELSVTAEGNQAVFSVRDHGGGIPPEAMEKLFTGPMPRTGDSKHGLGIGLSICRTIVQAHGGRIWAENCPDGGARFSFSLPMEEDTQ